MTGQGLGSSEFGEGLRHYSNEDLVVAFVGSDAGYRNEADGALLDLMQDRDPEVCDINPSPEVLSQYRDMQAEVVRRAVGYLGLSVDFLFGKGQGE